ncbi:MAG: aminotransferase class V-fold PLP-dependent enzyme [Candidatus Thorarchaeota archaeon]
MSDLQYSTNESDSSEFHNGILDDFPLLKNARRNGKRLVYLDSAASSQRPRQVIEAVHAYYAEYNANIHRGIYEISERSTIEYEGAHKKVADFINADFEEVVFTRNTTESLNLVMYSYGMNNVTRKDEIVVSHLEHHSNFVPWQQLCKLTGANFKVIPVNEYGEIELSEAERLITDKTKILAITHVSNVLGTITPVKELVKLAHDHAAVSVVDGAQSAPHIKLNVKDLDADFFAFSAHKMLGPTGVGALYGKRDILEAIPPFLYGGDMISSVTVDQSKWNELPWKFEAGTTNIAGGIGFGAAIDYLKGLGMERVHKIEQDLLNYCLNRFAELDFIESYGPPPVRRAGVVSFNVKDVHSHDVASILDEHGICVRAGQHCAHPLLACMDLAATTRASFYIYNSRADIDRLVEGLNEVKELFDL